MNLNLKKRLTTRTMKKGSYSVGAAAVVLAIIVVINLIVGEIPSKYTKLDLSSSQIYSIGDQTKEVVNALDTDVTLYLMTEGGSTDAVIEEFLQRYADLSSHISVKIIDMVTSPKFTLDYTEDTVTSNSIIVASDTRSKVVSYNDMYEYEMDYTTYSYSTTGFDGEGQITSAISYVTTEDIPVLYVIEGHDEASLDSSLQSLIEKENIEVKTLNLLTSESVPEDADCLMILSPARDYSEEEAAKVIEYLEGGGNAYISSTYANAEMTNFLSVLDNYGVQPVEGMVFEGDSNYYYPNYPFYLFPIVQTHDVTSAISSSSYILIPKASGIRIADNYRSTLTIESLLKTTDSAYSKVNLDSMETYEKESIDIEGPFNLGVAITETYNDVETKIVYIANNSILDASIDNAVSGMNYKLITGALTWMCGQEVSVSIASKSLSTDYLTVTAGSVNFWSTVTTIVLPLGFVILGGVIWFRRRKA